MADPRFFHNKGPYSLAQLADLTASTLQDGVDGGLSLTDVAPLDKAGAGQVSFLDNRKYLSQFKVTKAAACFVSPDMVEFAPAGVALLVSKQPYKAYALAAQAFYPEELAGGVHETACIGKGATIGEGTVIEAGAVIGENVTLGKHCRVGPNAVISHAVIGDYVRIYPGVCIGQDGFGFAIDPAGYVKVPQLGRVVIEDHVEIGANTTIDRGAGPDTVIGAGTWIDNLVQIGHNVRVGKGCVIVSQAGISGSTVLEDYVMVAGQAGIAGHLTIGRGARIAGQSGVMRDVEAGAEVMGLPALPIKQFMRQVSVLKRLIQTKKSS